jgi:hypothetical protein
MVDRVIDLSKIKTSPDAHGFFRVFRWQKKTRPRTRGEQVR